MDNRKYWPELKKEVDDILLEHPFVKEGKMFGYPAYYINKKLALCHYEEGLAIKLPESSIRKLNQNSLVLSEPFCPMGKNMGNNWVIVLPEKPDQIREIQSFLFDSINFIKERTEKK